MEKNDQNPRSKYGRRFDEEFKRDAVRMLESRVRSAEQLAVELGVSSWSLKRWAKHYGSERPGGAGGGKYALTPGAGNGQPATRHPKKSLGHLGPGTDQFYEVITKMRTEQSGYSIAEMCLALGVSRSGLKD